MRHAFGVHWKIYVSGFIVGKRITSLIVSFPVSIITVLSTPIPIPPVGCVPAFPVGEGGPLAVDEVYGMIFIPQASLWGRE